MSLAMLRTPGAGRHRSIPEPELRATIADQARTIETLTHDLTQALLRADKSDALAKTLAGRVVRAEAEQRRLRQAVINARPRITYAPPPLVPPYAALSLPYPVPVQGPDTSAETTQKIPILDVLGRAS